MANKASGGMLLSAEEKSAAAIEIFWSGDSFLLRRVVVILGDRYGATAFGPALTPESSATLIHDGALPQGLGENFHLDFNVNDYGQKPDEVAENLWQRIHSSLV